MKNIVISDEFKGSELKPSNLLKEYIALVAKEIDEFFPAAKLSKVNCPACASADVRREFNKLSLTYHECAACLTLYVSKRPSDEAIVNFYKASKARSFWNEKLYSTTAPRRQEKIIKPRFQWMEDSTQEYLPKAQHYADINANQRGYLPQISSLGLFSQKTLVNPLFPYQPNEIPSGIQVSSKLDGRYDVVSLFEVLDHASDVAGLFKQLHGTLNDGGLIFLTGIFASGFDIKVLGEHAENIYPPDRLNVFTVEGIKKLAEVHGYECLELSTPGILDVDFVAKALREEASIEVSVFVRDLALNSNDETRRAFQDFLQANLLSSYGRVCLRKVSR
jgi:hypothetical protein